MPEIKNFGYLLDYLIELGFVESDSGEIKAISFSEIKSWADLVNVNLNPFEVSTLKRMSSSYVDMYYKARKEIPAPYLSDKDLIKMNKAGYESFKRMAKK